jgi:hypothetical protein
MSAYSPTMLTKIVAVGLMGVFLSMGLLLYTLKVVDHKKLASERPPISQLAFESLLRQGEVVECTLAEGRLTGLRRGTRDETVEPFRVEGEISPRLEREIARQRVPLRKLSPASTVTGPSGVK